MTRPVKKPNGTKYRNPALAHAYGIHAEMDERWRELVELDDKWDELQKRNPVKQ